MMIPNGFKNCLKSFSLGNLNMIVFGQEKTRYGSTPGLEKYDDNIIDFNECPVSAGSSIRNNKHNLSSTNLMDYESSLNIQTNFNASFNNNTSSKNLNLSTPNRTRQRRSSFSLLFPTKGFSEMDQKDNRGDQIRELGLKLKEFSASVLSSSVLHGNDNEINFPTPLLENNFKQLQNTVSKEVYQQQSAIWELLVTEQNFLKQIQFIVQVYVLGFEILRQEFFPKIISENIFSNLKEVSRVSFEFWKQCMQPVVDNYEKSKHLFNPQHFKNGFIKIGDILEPYILYCTEISKCRSSILSLEKSNELFSEYMKWAMNLEESNREMLCDHLAKPFLRLTKYKILLQAVQKYSDINEKTEMQEMIDSVDNFVSLVNEKIEETSLMKTLQYLNSHIDTYDVIEPLGDDLIPIINQYSKFDLTTPILLGKYRLIRQSLHQGMVKLREGSSKTVDVKLFLFTDVLLVTKYKKKTLGKLKIIKPPISLDAVVVRKQSNYSFVCICLNDFSCISSLYHFSNGDQRNIDKWIQILEEAVRFYTTLRSGQLYPPMSVDSPEPLPTLNVVQSSPRQEKSRQKTLSNSESLESELQIEFSFKRKAPVTKKHKNKKEISILKTKSNSADAPQRKGSNPITKPPSVIDKNSKLYKSNSFAEETDKNKIIKPISDCSDIDEPYNKSQWNSFETNQIAEKEESSRYKQASGGDVQIKDNRKVTKTNETASVSPKKYQSETSPNIDTTLTRKLSISLNSLSF